MIAHALTGQIKLDHPRCTTLLSQTDEQIQSAAADQRSYSDRIALTDEEIEELYRVTPDGTPIEIQP